MSEYDIDTAAKTYTDQRRSFKHNYMNILYRCFYPYIELKTAVLFAPPAISKRSHLILIFIYVLIMARENILTTTVSERHQDVIFT